MGEAEIKTETEIETEIETEREKDKTHCTELFADTATATNENSKNYQNSNRQYCHNSLFNNNKQ